MLLLCQHSLLLKHQLTTATIMPIPTLMTKAKTTPNMLHLKTIHMRTATKTMPTKLITQPTARIMLTFPQTISMPLMLSKMPTHTVIAMPHKTTTHTRLTTTTATLLTMTTATLTVMHMPTKLTTPMILTLTQTTRATTPTATITPMPSLTTIAVSLRSSSLSSGLCTSQLSQLLSPQTKPKVNEEKCH